MTGRFIAFVGPSGVGKDSVMDALVAFDPRFVRARRTITRPKEAGSEDYDGVTLAEFVVLREAGAFALSWDAHGLSYAIPASVDAEMQQGNDVIANLSRGMIAQAAARFEAVEVVALTAPKDVLEKRLMGRGREDAADILRRLDRPDYPLPATVPVHRIDNSGALEQTVGMIHARLHPVRA